MIQDAPVPRQRRRKANRERILEAAAEIVFAEGVEALSIKRVADAADYTPGALYRYFPSKDALLAAVVVRIIEELAADLAGSSAPGGPPLRRVVELCLAYRDFAKRQPHAFGLLSELIAKPRVLIEVPEDASTVGAAVARALAPLGAALEEAVGQGELRPGDGQERAVLLWAGLQGTLQLRKQERVARDLIDADALTGAMLETLLIGFGAEPHRVAALLKEPPHHVPNENREERS